MTYFNALQFSSVKMRRVFHINKINYHLKVTIFLRILRGLIEHFLYFSNNLQFAKNVTLYIVAKVNVKHVHGISYKQTQVRPDILRKKSFFFIFRSEK